MGLGRMLGKLFKLLFLLILIGLIAATGFVYFIGANHFKPHIVQAIRTYTGLPLEINGEMDWVLRPKTTLHMQDVALPGSTSDDKTPALQIKDVTLTVDVVSLMKGNPKITNLTFNNVLANWAKLKPLLNNASTSGKPFNVSDFELKNGSIALQDPTDHLNWLLQNATLTGANLMLNSGQSLPAMQIKGDLINIDRNIQYQIDSSFQFDPDKHELVLDPLKMTWNATSMQGSAHIQQFDTDPIISGNISLLPTDVGALLKKMDPYFANSDVQIAHTLQMQTDYSYATKDQVLDLTKLNLQIDKGMMSGALKVGFTSPYHAEFSLSAQNFDLAPLSLLGSAFFPSLHKLNSLPTDFIKELAVKGKFAGTELNYDNVISIDQIQMEVNGQNGVMQFTPVVINAYGGTHAIALNIDVTKDQPTYQLTEQADKIDAGPLLKVIHKADLIGGAASLKMALQASGIDLNTIRQTLNGNISLYVNNGVLYGVDTNKLMQFTDKTVLDIFNELSTSPAANLNVLAIKRSSNWIETQANKPQSKFSNLVFTAEITQGASKKASLAMNNNVIDLRGTGSFTLSDLTLNFDTTMMNRADIDTEVKILSNYMKQSPLNMSITGTIIKPVFGPNVQTFVMNVLTSTKTDLLNQAISKMVAVTPPNTKTDKTATELFLGSLQSLAK